ncbi:integrase family protein [Bradyrhizobium sp. ISRA443]|uniref:tyrosine-type recombinase/integrase n=1 Tax=unclassified Bradyrhizobium TaxID=2631580 RepID=UPI00247AAC44|nr:MULTISPECIES: integrase arm-type DNA-binding domain-containing protein [unclassified Bradyrhizobium]WGR93199.1 integrase family protein [Bradyrhizobium sp. ISRA435]WGR97717.1 integrase family protein [Bradyrhizobium sp. ISRA436]WGS04607.1 integrase family protein [Bradyrhizobium sp. ISRA437]WGS11488.1 integrase family protein [Bradyrhizobium sp. ISRA443]
MNNTRILLSDKTIAQLPTPKDGWYLARDTELKGFFVVVGRRKRTFTVQGDLRQGGKRSSSIRVSIGDTRELTTRTARAMAKEYLAQISKGQHPKATKEVGHSGSVPVGNTVGATVTLRQAWQRYLVAHLIRKGRSEKTISGYRDHVERLFAEWLDTPLSELAMNPARVANKHDDLTKQNGPYIANGSMRTLRAIYNHARKTNRSLPRDNPADAIDWNEEKRRDTGMGISDLTEWFRELAALENPVRREFHLLTLLSGSRTTALQQVKPSHIDFHRRTLHIEKPKGGRKRAFDIPLSREMILCLIRTIRFGRQIYPLQSQKWVFPGDSASGHLAETKEDRGTLSKWGNDLRQTFRTVASAAGVSEFDAKLLMNHSIPGVNAGYVTRQKLLEDHLRGQQQAISTAVFSALGKSLTKDSDLGAWLGRWASCRAASRVQTKPDVPSNEQDRATSAHTRRG